MIGFKLADLEESHHEVKIIKFSHFIHYGSLWPGYVLIGYKIVFVVNYDAPLTF